jgi:hypothetical protein
MIFGAVGAAIGDAVSNWGGSGVSCPPLPIEIQIWNAARGGGQPGKGERGQTAKPAGTRNPGKKFVFDAELGRWTTRDPQTGKLIVKGKGFVPPQ